MVTEVPLRPKHVDHALIAACANARQALSLCIRLSGYTDEVVAKKLGISKGYLSKILNGRASLNGDRRIKLMRVCGNRAPLQYEEFELDGGKAAKKAALHAQLAALEAA